MTDAETAATKRSIGTLFVDEAGNAYRLRGYGRDWENEDNPDPEAIPDYAVLRIDGGIGVAHELPDTTRLIWEPAATGSGSGDTKSAVAVELWDADADCEHEIVDASGGGIRCTKCHGWMCL